MTYRQVRDVVVCIRNAHRQVRDALESPRCRAPDSRTRYMLEVMRREEQRLQLALAQLEEQGRNGLMDTWLQYIPDEELRTTLAIIEFTPAMTADEVVARKLSFDQALISLLRTLATETAVPRVQEFFKALLEQVETRAAQQVWSLQEFQPDGDPPDLGG